MADVTLTLAAKDQGVAATLQRVSSRLSDFTKRMGDVSSISAKVQARFGGLTQKIVGLAAAYFSVSQAASAFNKVLDLGGKLDDLGKITGATAGEMLLLQKAFELGGSSADMVAPVISRLSRFLAEAKLGGEAQNQALKNLGLTYQDLAKLAPTEQMRLLAQRIMQVQDPTMRTKAAMDIFGRAGASLLPLLSDFSGELDKARGYLGSLPEIMDNSASKFADLGDAMAAIGDKLTQFTAGFLDSAAGVNSFAESLANFDAAGFGQKIGRLFAGIAQDPGSGFLLFGEMLLLGVKIAGNALVDAAIYAGTVWQKYLADPKAQESLGDALIVTLQGVLNWFNKAFYTLFKNLISLLDTVTGGLMPFAQESIAGIDELLKQFENQADNLRKAGDEAATSAAERLADIAANTPRPAPSNLFDVADQQAQVDALRDRLSQLGAPSPQAPPSETSKPDRIVLTPDEMREIYSDEMEKLREAGLSAGEFAERVKTLNQQMYEAMQNLQNHVINSPMRSLDGAMNRPAREQAANNAAASPDYNSNNVASESTLMLVARYLESLESKLPQPVLV